MATVWPGRPAPLGETFDGSGTNFALFSEVADRVELCLFGPDQAETRITLGEREAGVWHGYLPGVSPGTRYGYRVHGPDDPHSGLRCNPNRLLLDPYTRAVDGHFDPAVSELGDDIDSAPFVGRSVVVSSFFDWSGDHPPRTPWADTVLYEAHVRGLTISHPGVPPELRGTYAGLAHPAVLEHLMALGVTAVQLLPVMQSVVAPRLAAAGLTDYWGYNPIALFAPHQEYAAGPGSAVAEFRGMVRDLHAAGLEVILDIPLSHTAEGADGGPTLSLRGIDNPAYYELDPDDPQRYRDHTGHGNAPNARHPRTLQLILDALRYWVTDMHVDGFRIATEALARGLHAQDRLGLLADLLLQDPVLNQVKIIGERWDVDGGYGVVDLPPLWAERNGYHQNVARELWRGSPGFAGEFARGFGGSTDQFSDDAGRPHTPVDTITAHDGFTLVDLVSYAHRHNEANGEGGADGEAENRSWNCGAEGPTDDQGILGLRHRQMRNLLATLLLGRGVPMISHGDELGRTQQGNNNAYSQDNALSWVDWDLAGDWAGLTAFVAALVALRRDHPVFRRPSGPGAEVVMELLGPDGTPPTDMPPAFQIRLRGPGPDDWALLLVNPTPAMVTTTLPRVTDQPRWRVAVDTVDGAVDGLTPGTRYASATDPFRLDPHSLIALLPLA